jgi:hypothetical protein
MNPPAAKRAKEEVEEVAENNNAMHNNDAIHNNNATHNNDAIHNNDDDAGIDFPDNVSEGFDDDDDEDEDDDDDDDDDNIFGEFSNLSDDLSNARGWLFNLQSFEKKKPLS